MRKNHHTLSLYSDLEFMKSYCIQCPQIDPHTHCKLKSITSILQMR